MDNFYLSAILEEIRPALLTKTLARIFLADHSLFFDFRLPDESVLRATFDPSSPGLYLYKLGKEITNDAHPFLTSLRKELTGAKLINIFKPRLDRLVCLEFASE